MKPEFKVQHSLMTKAIMTLNDIEIMEGMFDSIDNEYLINQRKQLEREYAETMSELAVELALYAKEQPITNNQTQY